MTQQDYPDGELDEAYLADSIKRAGKKLSALRTGMVEARSLGRITAYIAWVVIFALLGSPFLYFAIDFLADRDPDNDAVAIIFFALAALCLVPVPFLFVGSKADTPKRSLRHFYKSVGTHKMARARALVVPNDFDDFPRYLPDIPGHLPASDDPFFFNDREAFSEYWMELLKPRTSPYCVVRFRRFRQQEIGPDLVVVSYRLHLITNTSLWYLFILLGLVGLVITAIVDAATRLTIEDDLHKILVRVEGEWHLLNGAWQGPEEENADRLEG